MTGPIRARSGEDTVALVTIKKRSDFLRAQRGRRAASRGLVVQFVPCEAGDETFVVHVGFTATKKIGNAVVRNRAKRRLRELARGILAQEGRPGALYVLIARQDTATRPYDRLVGDLRSALHRVHDQGGRDRR